MAEGLTSAIGDALLQLVQFVWPAAAPRVEHFARQVADAVRPDPPFTLQTEDGEVITGFVILDRGNALFFFGTRQPRVSVSRQAYPVPERTYPERGYPERSYDADPSLWSARPYTR